MRQWHTSTRNCLPWTPKSGRCSRPPIPELAAKATWADRDVYISGPDHMTVKTARVLRERGTPDRLIHYDMDP